MTVEELIYALTDMPGDLEVLVMNGHSNELDEAAVDLARRLPPGVPIKGMYDWAWEQNAPGEEFSERIVVIY